MGLKLECWMTTLIIIIYEKEHIWVGRWVFVLFIFHKGLADYYRKIFTLLGEMRSKDGCQYPARENCEGLLPLAPAIICCMCLCVQEKKPNIYHWHIEYIMTWTCRKRVIVCLQFTWFSLVFIIIYMKLPFYFSLWTLIWQL